MTDTAVGIRHADHVAPLYPLKLVLPSPTSGCRPVGIVRSRTQATEFFKGHATSRKVSGSRPNEVNEFFQFT
jgi:hypothetical protein